MALVPCLGHNNNFILSQPRHSLSTNFLDMVAFNMLWKLCLVVAFGLSATATSTDVAQEQPKKEELISGISSEREQPRTESQEVQKPKRTETPENTKTGEHCSLSLEWLLLPEPKSRKRLLDELPFDIAIDVSMDFNEPIKRTTKNRIRKFFFIE